MTFFFKNFSTDTNLNFFEKNANFLSLYIEKNLLKIIFSKNAEILRIYKKSFSKKRQFFTNL
ncbi:MAG: hypothetical protein B6I24_00560 [Bacteroidetes bacterium 4572_128]|nr:MAG: hypothetical protein B6I24_00560 [Bacteroidetes bacterium 4572_128]